MTRLQAADETDSHYVGGTISRLLFGTPLAVLLAILSLISLSWTGWGSESDPAAQLLRDAPWVVIAGLTGAGAGAVLAWAVLGRRVWAVALGAAIGALPAAVMVTAYFTDAY